MSLFFAVVIGERVLQMWAQGVLIEYRIWLGSVIAPVALVGLALGTVARRRLSIDKRRLGAVITALLLAAAGNLLWKALPQLVG